MSAERLHLSSDPSSFILVLREIQTQRVILIVSCNSMNSRAVSSRCNLDALIQLKDKCAATSLGNGSASGFKDLLRDRRAELGNH